MTTEPPLAPDLAALAAEACDLWQEHLAAASTDPQTRDALLKMIEPSQRLFAGWAAMMQSKTDAFPPNPPPAPAGPAPAGPAPDDGALRVAQLAYRMGELEKRLAALERAVRTRPPAPPAA